VDAARRSRGHQLVLDRTDAAPDVQERAAPHTLLVQQIDQTPGRARRSSPSVPLQLATSRPVIEQELDPSTL